jgi:hypothetical protein
MEPRVEWFKVTKKNLFKIAYNSQMEPRVDWYWITKSNLSRIAYNSQKPIIERFKIIKIAYNNLEMPKVG